MSASKILAARSKKRHPRKLLICFENRISVWHFCFSLKVDYLLRKDVLSYEILVDLIKSIIRFEIVIVFAKLFLCPRKSVIFFGNIILSFEHIFVSKKVNYLLRKYDLFVQTCDFFKEMYLFAPERFRADHTYARRKLFCRDRRAANALVHRSYDSCKNVSFLLSNVDRWTVKYWLLIRATN